MNRTRTTLTALVLLAACSDGEDTASNSESAAFELCVATVQDFLGDEWSVMGTASGALPFAIPSRRIVAGDPALLADSSAMDCVVLATDPSGDEQFIVRVKPPAAFVVAER